MGSKARASCWGYVCGRRAHRQRRWAWGWLCTWAAPPTHFWARAAEPRGEYARAGRRERGDLTDICIVKRIHDGAPSSRELRHPGAQCAEQRRFECSY